MQFFSCKHRALEIVQANYAQSNFNVGQLYYKGIKHYKNKNNKTRKVVIKGVWLP
jgi:hypothetical protein